MAAVGTAAATVASGPVGKATSPRTGCRNQSLTRYRAKQAVGITRVHAIDRAAPPSRDAGRRPEPARQAIHACPVAIATTAASAISPGACHGLKPVHRSASRIAGIAEAVPASRRLTFSHAGPVDRAGTGASPDRRKASAFQAPCPTRCSNAAGNAARRTAPP